MMLEKFNPEEEEVELLKGHNFVVDVQKVSLKRYKSSQDEEGKLGSLPDELLIRILSLVPTKDAAAMTVLSRRFRGLLAWISNIDLDGSLISHCAKRSHLIERLPSFKSFVDSVLEGSQSQHLARFRLRLGGDKRTVWNSGHRCEEDCSPDLKPAQVLSWISFPLTRSGLRELDLFLRIRKPVKLPPEIFTCETLEVLKLDTTLEIDHICSLKLSFCLPNVKVLHLSTFLIPEDDFLTRLVSSCPSL